jgi:alpha,alpha-trehalase
MENVTSTNFAITEDETLLDTFCKVWVKDTLRSLLDQEDPDGDQQITVKDQGPKVWRCPYLIGMKCRRLIVSQVMRLGTALSDGFKKQEVRGTYPLANLLEELYLANDHKRSVAFIDMAQLNENPVDRTNRKLRDMCWANLTRRLDGSLIGVAAPDPKDWTEEPRARIYVPSGEQEQYRYYCKIASDRPKLNLDVRLLPETGITQEFVHGLRDKPGLLALGMHRLNEAGPGQTPELQGLAFVVPGGRFNEFYYWDSYFCCLGLLEYGRTELAKQIVQNFVFEIQHYGKIPNANRSYYLSRSQPPFLTDLAVRTFRSIKDEEGAEVFLKTAISAAIKEYYQVWMAKPRYDPKSGLSRYRPPGLGIPSEVEEGHFDYILSEYAQKHSMTIPEFTAKYNSGLLNEPSLDQFLLHDRAVRESGHDTSYVFPQDTAEL